MFIVGNGNRELNFDLKNDMIRINLRKCSTE